MATPLTACSCAVSQSSCKEFLLHSNNDTTGLSKQVRTLENSKVPHTLKCISISVDTMFVHMALLF